MDEQKAIIIDDGTMAIVRQAAAELDAEVLIDGDNIIIDGNKSNNNSLGDILSPEYVSRMMEEMSYARPLPNYHGRMQRNGWKVKTGKTYQPNGLREVARRMRQIENGQLHVG